MRWIADTGPIIALAKVRKLSLLRDVADEVWIPPVVHRELYGRLSGVVPLLKRMRRNGYWLADEALDIARELAGE